jgi:CBS-domain-containing membrane protein
MKGEGKMERIKRVGEVMIPLDSYPHIPYWFTIRQAIVEMEKHELDVGGRRSLPRVVLVFDEKYQLMGTVRRRDILLGLEPKNLVSKPLEYRKKLFDVKIDPNLSEISYDKMLRGIKEQAERPVNEVMQEIKASVDVDDHIVKAIYEMVSNNVSLLPVLKAGRVVGVVRSVDLLHEIAQLLL